MARTSIYDRRAFGRGIAAEPARPDVTTMAGVFLTTWASLAETGTIEPLVVLRALPGAFDDECFTGPDGEPWRLYVFVDGTSLLVDGYATRFVPAEDVDIETRQAIDRPTGTGCPPHAAARSARRSARLRTAHVATAAWRERVVQKREIFGGDRSL